MFHGAHPQSPESGFATRLAYGRWLFLLRTGEYPTNRAIARGGGVSEAWVTKWQSSEAAPDGRTVARALSAYLGVPEPWLMDGEGLAPEPELWEMWLAQRGKPATETPAAARAKRQSEGGIPVREPRKVAKKRRG